MNLCINKFALISKILNEMMTPDSKINVNLYGLADRKKFTEQDADPNELSMGIKVEMEHTIDKEVSKKIAIDHLSEISDYYTRLSKMEKEAKKND